MKALRWVMLALCILLMAVSFTACDEDEAKVTGIFIDSNSIELVVDHNSVWSTEDIIVKAKLSNGEEKEISNVEFSQINTAITGEQILTVTYGEYTYTVTITVAPTVSGYELKGVPTTVNHKSQLDLAEAYLKINYSDGTTYNTLTSDITITAPDGTDTLGDFKYKVVYGTKELEFDYTVVKTVKDITVSGVTVNQIKYATTYNTNGITAVVTFSDDTTIELSSEDLTFTLPQNELGNQKLIVTYKDSASNTSASKEFAVEVYQELESINVTLNPESDIRGYYVIGEEFDINQFIVTANYTKDKNQKITGAIDITNQPDASTPKGNHTVYFSYTEGGITKTAERTIKVVESIAEIPENFNVTSIKIKDGTVGATNYGVDVDLSDLVLIATYNNDESLNAEIPYTEYQSDILVDFNKTPNFDGSATTATTKLTITYEDKQAECDVTVNRVLQNLKVAQNSNSVFNYAEEFVVPTVYAVYTDGKEFAVTVAYDNASNWITKPNKELFTNNQATVNVTLKYEYNVVASGAVNTVVYAVTVNDVITAIKITPATLADNILINTTINVNNLQLTETYASGNTATITYTADKYTISFDNKHKGNNDFIVTLKGSDVSDTVKVFVRNYTISSVEPSVIATQYKTNSNAKNGYTHQTSTGAKGFVKTGENARAYKVGNDNAFVFSPKLMVVYEDLTTGIETEFKMSAKVFIYEGEAYRELVEDLATYVSIDLYGHSFIFTDEAIGKRFKIAVGYGYSLLTDDNTTDTTFEEFEFEVVDGYNAYTAEDLSLIDNSNDGAKWSIWAASKGFDYSKEKAQATKVIILHNNISIDKDDIPANHIYSNEIRGDYGSGKSEAMSDEQWKAAGLEGYFINADNYTREGVVYKRMIADGDSFGIEGNYFTVSIQEDEKTINVNGNEVNNPEYDANQGLPKVKKPGMKEGEVLVSCTTLFGFIDENTEHRETGVNYHTQCSRYEIGEVDNNEENCYINNLSLFGNSQKDETTGVAGMVCYKTENVNFTIDNCLSQAWYIAHYFEGSSKTGENVQHKIANCTSFDSYNSLIYAQAARHLTIENSYLIGAGGPVMICDEETDSFTMDKNGYYVEESNNTTTNVTSDPYTTNVAVNNSVMMSWVVGTEAWFGGFEAAKTLAGGLSAALTGLNNNTPALATGALVDGKFNLVAVFKDAANADASGSSYADYDGEFIDVTDEEIKVLDLYNTDIIQAIVTNAKAQMIFQTYITGSMIGFDTNKNVMPFDSTGQLDTTGAKALDFITLGDYLTVHLFNGMGVVLGVDHQ